MIDIPKPSHAYVPGVNARHPDDWFDPLKQGVVPDMCESDMQESDAYHHRMRKAWGTFFKWREILLCKSVDIGTRLDFWHKTVAASIVWGLETTRASNKCVKIACRTQRHMIGKMLQRRRQKIDASGNFDDNGVLENFVQHKIRVNREIKNILRHLSLFL